MEVFTHKQLIIMDIQDQIMTFHYGYVKKRFMKFTPLLKNVVISN